MHAQGVRAKTRPVSHVYCTSLLLRFPFTRKWKKNPVRSEHGGRYSLSLSTAAQVVPYFIQSRAGGGKNSAYFCS